jgi:hypothetical protein
MQFVGRRDTSRGIKKSRDASPAEYLLLHALNKINQVGYTKTYAKGTASSAF